MASENDVLERLERIEAQKTARTRLRVDFMQAIIKDGGVLFWSAICFGASLLFVGFAGGINLHAYVTSQTRLKLAEQGLRETHPLGNNGPCVVERIPDFEPKK